MSSALSCLCKAILISYFLFWTFLRFTNSFLYSLKHNFHSSTGIPHLFPSIFATVSCNVFFVVILKSLPNDSNIYIFSGPASFVYSFSWLRVIFSLFFVYFVIFFIAWNIVCKRIVKTSNLKVHALFSGHWWVGWVNLICNWNGRGFHWSVRLISSKIFWGQNQDFLLSRDCDLSRSKILKISLHFIA